jgi:hypothetical protein
MNSCKIGITKKKPWSWKDVEYIVPDFEEQFRWMFDKPREENK